MSTFRAKQIQNISAALTPDGPVTLEQNKATIQALLVMAATIGLATARIPFTSQSVEAISSRIERELRRQIRRIKGGTN